MIFCNLASGSKGNCSYISDGKTSILIDAGISYKSLKNRCDIVGIDINTINAVFITHEHIDHVKGVQRLSELHDIPVYVQPKSFEADPKNLGLVSHIVFSEFIYPIEIGDFKISAFRVSHDANYTQGYVIENGGKKIVLATDLGYVPEGVFKKMIDADYIYIESNYDEKMLIEGSYPYNVKMRIKGKNGHLSNDDCANEIVKLAKEHNRYRFMLAHLSENNNKEEIVLNTLLSKLKANNINIEKMEIAIANQQNPSQIITI